MGRVAQIKVGMEMKQNRRRKRSFAVGNVNHGLLQTFLRQFDMNVVKGWSIQVTEDVKTPQGAEIIVDGVVRFDGETD